MTETIDSHFQDLDIWGAEQIATAIIQSNQRAVAATEKALPSILLAAAGLEKGLRAGGQLVYVGAGTSGRLALQDAVELYPTFGFDRWKVLLAGGSDANRQAIENAEDNTDEAQREILALGLGNNDVVIGLAASGKTPYTLAAIATSRSLGAFTIGIANNANTPLLQQSEVGIFIDSGPEVLAGSTRLAAGTSQKVVLNTLSTIVLVKLGGAYKNMMVGMKPTNEKLRQRAVGMVSQITGLDKEQVRPALEHSNWQIREAVVMLVKGLDIEHAKQRLLEHSHLLREALNDG